MNRTGRRPQASTDQVHRAREVVGLYGDPRATWAIGVEVTLTRPLTLEAIGSGLAALVDEHPHLGLAPVPEEVADDAWEDVRDTRGSQPFHAGDPLVRVLVGTSRRRLFVSAHHGVCDGLGLLAIVGAATGAPISATARGIGELESPRGFLASSMRRAFEAVVHPPARFTTSRPASHAGGNDRFLVAHGPRSTNGTAQMCHAVAQVFAATSGTAGRRTLLLVGASRRAPGPLAPDRQTGFLRLYVDPDWTVARVREELEGTEPEPTFPETSARGLGPVVTRLLRGRLGATALVSNLGVLEGHHLESVAMFPATSGPSAVAVGLASTASTTTVSLRVRSSEFSGAEAAELLAALVRALE